MRKSIICLCMLAYSVFILSAETDEAVRVQNQYVEFTLEVGNIFTIYTKKGNGVTTVQFPSAISEISGMNISIDGKGTDFIISAPPGSYYFNVSALKDGVTGTLTVTYNRKVYILYLVQDKGKAYSSVVFSSESRGGVSSFRNVANATPVVSPERLISLLDIAKAYNFLEKTQPAAVKGILHEHFPDTKFLCGRYNIILTDAYRFDSEDTIVFKVALENLTEEELRYDKTSFSANTGNRTYFMSVSDASGFIPPKSRSYAFFAITGTPTGGRNNLLPSNRWLIGVSVRPQIRTTVLTPEQFERLDEFRKLLSAEMKKREIAISAIVKQVDETNDIIMRFNDLNSNSNSKNDDLTNMLESELSVFAEYQRSFSAFQETEQRLLVSFSKSDFGNSMDFEHAKMKHLAMIERNSVAMHDYLEKLQAIVSLIREQKDSNKAQQDEIACFAREFMEMLKRRSAFLKGKLDELKASDAVLNDALCEEPDEKTVERIRKALDDDMKTISSIRSEVVSEQVYLADFIENFSVKRGSDDWK